MTILFMGVLMYTVPTHMKNLISYILSSNHLAIEKITQEEILFQLNENLLRDLGRVFLGVSSVLLVPSTLGYVGAVRESKELLIMCLTPLTTAAYLAKCDMFFHIASIEREVYWQLGNVTCSAYPLKFLDTIDSDSGELQTKSALNLIVFGPKLEHLDLIE